MFPTWEKCLISFLILGDQKFCLLLKKMYFEPQNSQIWPKIDIFGHFGPYFGLSDPCPTKHQCKEGTPSFNVFNMKEVSSWIPDVGLPIVVLPIKRNRNLGPKLTFLAILGQTLACLAHLVPCPSKKKQIQTMCLGSFWICKYQKICSLPQK